MALQRRGHTVAMTGDGVNDALALKQADIGVAMNSAAAATKAVARLVLLDGRFGRLPAVLAEGRRVIANVERVSVLFLSKTAYALALSVTFGALLWEFPFLPRQLSVTDGLTIGIPAFFLALMPNPRRYVPGFLRRSLAFSLPAGLLVAAAVVAVNVYAALAGGYPAAGVRTASLMTLSIVALGILVVISLPLNRVRWAIIAGMCGGLVLVLVLPASQEFLTLEWPPLPLLAVSLGAAVAGTIGVAVLAELHARRYPAAAPVDGSS